MMTAIIERQRARLYTQKAKNCEMFLYTQSQTLFKELDNFRYVFIYKKAIHLTLRDFHKFLKLVIYKKLDTSQEHHG